jgi:hypothetical protein
MLTVPSNCSHKHHHKLSGIALSVFTQSYYTHHRCLDKKSFKWYSKAQELLPSQVIRGALI